MKGKSLRRALETRDVIRIGGDVPLITDTTELITPQVAQEMLKRNRGNRPINWKAVEKYADLMAAGKWELHAQGIVLDTEGNILTGQKRLWAVIYSDTSVYMRVSRGNPARTAKLLDRGTPQTARDLASRDTDRRHGPTESSIARGICVLNGNTKPSPDELAAVITENSSLAMDLLRETSGTKKTKSVIMLLSAVCVVVRDVERAKLIARRIDRLVTKFEMMLLPHSADQCWGRGAAFGLAMEHARKCVETAE